MEKVELEMADIHGHCNSTAESESQSQSQSLHYKQCQGQPTVNVNTEPGSGLLLDHEEVQLIHLKLRSFSEQLTQCLANQSEFGQLLSRVEEVENELELMRRSVIYLEGRMMRSGCDTAKAEQDSNVNVNDTYADPLEDSDSDNLEQEEEEHPSSWTETETKAELTDSENVQVTACASARRSYPETLQIRIVNDDNYKDDPPVDIFQVVEVVEDAGAEEMYEEDGGQGQSGSEEEDEVTEEEDVHNDTLNSNSNDFQEEDITIEPEPESQTTTVQSASCEISNFFNNLLPPTPDLSTPKHACNTCPKRFNTRHELARHKFNQHVAGENPLKCTACGRIGFGSLVELAEHTARVHEDTSNTTTVPIPKPSPPLTSRIPTFCSICTLQFKSKALFLAHCREAHQNIIKPYSCKVCPEAFYNSQKLAEHYTTQHPTPNGLAPAGLPCTVCGKKLARMNDLRRHMTSHAGGAGAAFDCEYCGKGFTRKDSLTRHLTMKRCGEAPEGAAGGGAAALQAKRTVYTCSECDKKLTNRSLMERHIFNCHGQKAYKCDECGKEFASRSNLRDHCHSVHEKVKRFTCDDCGQGFFRLGAYNAHLETHSQVRLKPHLCNICGQTFGKLHDAVRHEKMHAGILEFHCQDCGRGFSRQNSLNKHRRCHTEQRAHTCSECLASYSSVSALTAHRRLHNPSYAPEKVKRASRAKGAKVKVEAEADAEPIVVDLEEELTETETETETQCYEYEVMQILEILPSESSEIQILD